MKGLVVWHISNMRHNMMKRYCKNVDITDLRFIEIATYNCLDDKFTRHDTLDLLGETVGLTAKQIYYIIRRLGKLAVYPIIDVLVKDIQRELKTNSVNFPKIWYRKKIDPSNFKVREIGIQNVKQQIYDYIAVNAMESLGKRIGVHQYASIKGRGQAKGIKQIARWTRNKNLKYVGKADIKKCYPSIDHEKLMSFLNKRIKNDKLMYLLNVLIRSFGNGLSIGSYLSQFLCNLYLSQLYHEIHENMFKTRKKRNGTCKRVKLVSKCLFYMDDILILGTSAKDLHKAMNLINEYAEHELGVKIKRNWIIYKMPYVKEKERDKIFIDMMGMRIYRKHISIRDYVFIRIRRAYLRVAMRVKEGLVIPVSCARRVISYNGIIKCASNFKLQRKYDAKKIIRICKEVIRHETVKSKIRHKTASCFCS